MELGKCNDQGSFLSEGYEDGNLEHQNGNGNLNGKLYEPAQEIISEFAGNI